MPSGTSANPLDGSGRLLRPAALLFFASGFAALLYQVLWQRILGVFSGVHIYSITLIVTAFMAGLGFGSLCGGRLADRLPRRAAVLAFAVCELCIGLFALVSPWLYYDVAYLKLGWLVRWPLALPLVHLLLLLVPTLLMGASLPLLARSLVLRTETAARTVGVLYGINTLGAAAGALCAAWFFIGALGFVWTIRAGAVLNLLVAAGAAALYGRVPAETPTRDTGATHAGPAADPGGFRLRTWCLLYALSGFVALSLELVWFRVLDVAIKSSPYTFGHLLGLFLGFLAVGSLVGATRVAEVRRPAVAFLWGQWCISVSAGLALLALWALPAGWPLMRSWHAYWGNATHSFEMVDLLRGLAGGGEPGVLAWAAQLYLLLPIVLLAVPTFLMGLTFTWIQRAVQTDIHAVGWRVGAVQTANIVGSILGSLLTGALLLRLLGTASTLALLLAVGGVFGLLASLRHATGPGRLAAVGSVGASLLLAFAVPGPVSFWGRFHGASAGSLLIVEDASGVAGLHTVSSGMVALRVNGKMHSNLPFRSIHTVLGIVPGLVHPEIRRALVIGLGSGTTPWAVAAAAPRLEQLDVYEIVKPEIDVLREFQRNTPYAALGQLLEDPRIRFEFADGRLALRTRPELYDLIEADALDPSMAFSGNLYSKEFFELCRSRLAPGGILLTYVPTERTRRTVLAVFPHALDFHAPGTASFIIAADHALDADREAMLARLRDPSVQSYLDASGEASAATTLVSAYLERAEIIRIGPANRERFTAGDTNGDLFPRDEFDKTYDASYE